MKCLPKHLVVLLSGSIFPAGMIQISTRNEKPLGALLVPQVIESVGGDFSKSVFSYVPQYCRECVLWIHGAVTAGEKSRGEAALNRCPPGW